MTGPGIYSYSTTPANNVQANTGINWDEGMPPAAVNNSARQNMTDTRNAFNDLVWFKYGKGDLDYSPVYASATSFTVAGADVTTVYHTGRRVRAVGSSTGTVYGTISSSSYSTNTTVNVIWDSGSLSNETLTVSLGQVPVTGKPVPVNALSDTPVLQNYLTGLTLSTAGSSATFSVAAGQAADSTNAAIMTLTSALAKTTGSWTVGNNQGGLDTGSIATTLTWYHVWQIKRVDTGVVDVLISLSASSPTMPTNYTLKRRIGSVLCNASSQWVAFTQIGDTFIWSAAVRDLNGVTLPTGSRTLYTLTVPTGVNVTANFRAFIAVADGSAIFTSPSESDQASGSANGIDLYNTTASSASAGRFAVMTDTSARIGGRAGAASTTCYVHTFGWVDTRGKG